MAFCRVLPLCLALALGAVIAWPGVAGAAKLSSQHPRTTHHSRLAHPRQAHHGAHIAGHVTGPETDTVRSIRDTRPRPGTINGRAFIRT